MSVLVDVIVAVTANVIGGLICRWFDRHNKR